MAVDSNWSSVALLLPMTDDTNDVRGHTITAYGGATLSSAAGTPFGSGNSLFLDGVNDYLTTPDSVDFTVGSGDFTIEAWVNFVAHTTDVSIVGQRVTGGSNHSMSLAYINTGSAGFRWSYTTDGVTVINVDRAWTPTNGVWYHLSVIRTTTIVKFKVNGVQLGADYTIGSSTIYDSSALLYVGAINATPGGFFSGYIGPLRFTKYARTITAAPTAPFPRPTISGTVYDSVGAKASKVVVAIKRSNMTLAGQALSDGTLGTYTIYPSDFSEHIVAEFDTATYPLVDGGSGENALIYDRVIPG